MRNFLSRFIYDFITYPFGLFSTPILASVEPPGTSYGAILGWNVVVKYVHAPSPKYALTYGYSVFLICLELLLELWS